MEGLVQLFLDAKMGKATDRYRIHMEAVHHIIVAADVLIQIAGRGCVHMGEFGEVLGLKGPKEDLFEVLDFDTRILLRNAKKGFLTF